MKKILFILSLVLAFHSVALAGTAKKGASVMDSEYDTLGNTCKANGKCTYTHREVLPGGIKAEVQIVSLGAFKGNVDEIFNYAFGDVRRVADLLDENNPNGETAKVNNNAGGGFVEVGPEFAQLIDAAKKVYLWTDGAFDISTAPENGTFKNIKIKNNLVLLKKPGMKISFKNIINGYIADLLIRAIYNSSIDNALVEVGTTSRSIGTSVAGPWRTQVDDSTNKLARRGMTLDTSNVSVGSVVAGANAPTVDPRWNIPLDPAPCRSVTIISRNAAISEALAAGIFVLGPQKGLPLMTTLQTVKGVIVDNDGNFLKSPGL
jgi:thiamine biosynthesis lipoprotein